MIDTRPRSSRFVSSGAPALALAVASALALLPATGHRGALPSNSVSFHPPDRTSCRRMLVSSAVLTLKDR